MTYEQALDLLAHRDSGKKFSPVPRLRKHCREDNPDILQRDGYRRQVVLMAGGAPPEPVAPPVIAAPLPEPPAPRTPPVAVQSPAQPVQHYPPVRQQAKNLWRSVKGWVRSGMKLAPKEVRKARLAICVKCEFYDQVQRRCTRCGCSSKAKTFVASDSCPLPNPKWTAV